MPTNDRASVTASGVADGDVVQLVEDKTTINTTPAITTPATTTERSTNTGLGQSSRTSSVKGNGKSSRFFIRSSIK